MLDFGALNWWAVLVSMIVTVINGSLWFGPKMFFKVWWRGMGKTEKDIPGAGLNMKAVFGLTFLASFIQPLFFALVLNALFPNGATVAEGLNTAIILFVGFIAASSLSNKLFAGYRPSVWLLESGNHLINYLVFGILFSIWK